jgi:ABC-type maltose transport system permease subunit
MIADQPFIQPSAGRVDHKRPPPSARQMLLRGLLYAVIVGCTILFITPFLWLVSNSLKDSAHAFDANWIPQPIMWSNYSRIFQELPLLLMARNSIIVSVLGVLAVLLSSSMIAYARARLNFSGRRLGTALRRYGDGHAADDYHLLLGAETVYPGDRDDGLEGVT